MVNPKFCLYFFLWFQSHNAQFQHILFVKVTTILFFVISIEEISQVVLSDVYIWCVWIYVVDYIINSIRGVIR